MKEVAPGVLVSDRAVQIVHAEPSPDHLRAVSDEVDHIRMLISEARSRLQWLAFGSVDGTFEGISDHGSEGLPAFKERWSVPTAGALTLAISFLYPAVAEMKEAADRKEALLARDGDGVRVEPGWRQRVYR
jgi:hypothetical protein